MSREMPGQICSTTLIPGWYHAQKPIPRWYKDIRAHREIHLRTWTDKGSQGVLAKLAMSTGNKIHEYKGNGTPSSISKFFAKLINSVAHTPHMSYKIGKEATSECPLCGHPDATAKHILLHCPSHKLSAARKQLNKTLMEKLQVDTHQYNQPQSRPHHTTTTHQNTHTTNTTHQST